MQRLTAAPADRGAVAVWLAILLIPLMVIAALAIDVAGMHADRQRLQTGADAAALAVAYDCATAPQGCTDAAADITAQFFASENDPLSGDADATAALPPSGGRVDIANTSLRDNWFAPFVDIPSTRLTAISSATWGAPSSSSNHLPIVFSWCEILSAAGGAEIRNAAGQVVGLDLPSEPQEVEIYSFKGPDRSCKPGNAANQVPGGFGWINTTPCRSTSTQVGVPAPSRTGNNPGNCSQADFAYFASDRDGDGRPDPLLLPVYNSTQDSGSNASYNIIGYVTFRLQAWQFNGGIAQDWPDGRSACGSGRCFGGTIERFVTSAADVNNGGPAAQLGSQTVTLVLP